MNFYARGWDPPFRNSTVHSPCFVNLRIHICILLHTSLVLYTISFIERCLYGSPPSQDCPTIVTLLALEDLHTNSVETIEPSLRLGSNLVSSLGSLRQSL